MSDLSGKIYRQRKRPYFFQQWKTDDWITLTNAEQLSPRSKFFTPKRAFNSPMDSTI